MKKLVLPLAVACGFWLGSWRIHGVEERLRNLEVVPHADPESVSVLYGDVEGVQSVLDAVCRDLDDRTDSEVLSSRLQTLEEELQSTGQGLVSASARLEGVETRLGSHRLEEYDRYGDEINALSQRLQERCEELGQAALEAARMAREGRKEIETLRAAQAEIQTVAQEQDPQDTGVLWDALLGPTVQVTGRTTVGTGVVVSSYGVDGSTVKAHTQVLTAWHVVRDLFSDPSRTDVRVGVSFYGPDGSSVELKARVLAHDVRIDVALLEVEDTQIRAHTVRLPGRERLARVSVFDPVRAVGCPLGNDPIPTVGEIASTHHEIGGDTYWMISAPTYIGNSGGGVFDADSHELLGIFSKIYTHGSVRSTIVPHMGLMVPMDAIYDWLEGQGLAEVVDSSDGLSLRTASAGK